MTEEPINTFGCILPNSSLLSVKLLPDLPYQRHAPRSSGHHRSTAVAAPSPHPMALARRVPQRGGRTTSIAIG